MLASKTAERVQLSRRRTPGGPMRKLSISVPADVLAVAEKAVAAGKASSLSSYVTDALVAKVEADRYDSLEELFDEWNKELGPPTEADVEWASRILGV